MADLSYLFGNSVPTSITAGTTSTDNALPDWLQDYTRALMGNATQAAGETYLPYSGARIADQNKDQTDAAQGIRDQQGSWQPGLTYASGNINSTAIDPLTGQPVLNAQGQQQSNIQSYMNPYTDNVVKRIADIGTRNFTENLIPNVNSTFNGAGQFGSTRNSGFMNQAVRDANESIMGQQSQLLNQGYQQSVQNFQNDATRIGNSANMATQLGYQDLGMLDTSGLAQQNIQQKALDQGYNDFLEQRDYPKNQLDWLSQIMRGLPAQTQSVSSRYQTSDPSTMSPLQQAAAAFAGTRSALTGPSIPAAPVAPTTTQRP
jgi:hypothetical protein